MAPYQRQDLLSQDLIEPVWLLERRVVRRLFEPDEAFKRRLDFIKVLLSEDGGDVPIVAPEKEDDRHFEGAV